MTSPWEATARSDQTYEQSNGLFSAWTQISTSFPGGQIEGLAATSPSGSTNINVFAMGSNGALYQTYEQSNGLFSAWSEVRTSFPGGQLEGGLTATTPAGSTNINVFAMGSNGALYQAYEQSNGLFSAWSEVRTSFPGGQLVGGSRWLRRPPGRPTSTSSPWAAMAQLYQAYEQSNGFFSAWTQISTSFPGWPARGGLHGHDALGVDEHQRLRHGKQRCALPGLRAEQRLLHCVDPDQHQLPGRLITLRRRCRSMPTYWTLGPGRREKFVGARSVGVDGFFFSAITADRSCDRRPGRSAYRGPSRGKLRCAPSSHQYPRRLIDSVGGPGSHRSFGFVQNCANPSV